MVDQHIRVIRCFVALELPLEIQSELSQAAAKLKAAQADVKWVEPENVHLTVKFLGEIPHNKVLQIGMALSALGQRRAIASRLAGLGAFPVLNKPRVVWAGLDEGLEELGEIQKVVEDRMAELGFQREERGFLPHLTLGRVRSNRNAAELSRLITDTRPRPLEFAFRSLTLMKSTLAPGGSVYQPLQTVSLAE
jgi:2'-5' RNA ligase